MKNIKKVFLVTFIMVMIMGVIPVSAKSKKVKDVPNEWNVDKENYEFYIEKAEKPYYVGQQKSSFLKKNAGKYDTVLYLGQSYYLGENASEYSSSNTKVIKVVGDELVPMKQGLATLTTPEKKEIRIAVTTYNDNKNVITAMSDNKDLANHYYDAEDLKRDVKTISDAISVIMYRNYYYDYNEPFSQWDLIDHNWSWLESGKTCLEMNHGVCCDIAQVMNYLLVDDFEDVGVFWISGKQGHIFNYFYEDGYYYIFDATRVTGDDQKMYKDVSDYQNYIYKCKNIDEVKDVIFSDKQGIQKKLNYLVAMVSSQGHDYIEATYNESCCHASHEDVFDKKIHFKWGLDEEAYKGLTVLYLNPNCNCEVVSIPAEDIPVSMRICRTAVYCDTVRMVKKNPF